MTTVHPHCGTLHGSLDNGVYSYKGIPYAESLAGPALWSLPTPRKRWSGLRDARNYGPACMQFGGSGAKWPVPAVRAQYFHALGGTRNIVEGEDSLLLNVWTPSIEKTAKLPVMVWFHGGGFTSGSADEIYDAAPFASRGVVCVVIQYRLGPPGFLHGSGLFKGELCADNRAFEDQLCALRWVQENIASFGGDPSCVTLFGQSAGAFAIYQLIASPKGKDLFQRAIAMGGMAETCAPATEYHQLTRDALQDIGVKPGDSQALLSLDRQMIVKLQAAIMKRIFRGKNPEQYGSLSRNRIAFVGAATGTEFLPLSPLETFRKGTPGAIDLMLGTCANDGNLFSMMTPLGRTVSSKLFSGNLQGLVPKGDMDAARKYYKQQMPGAGNTFVIEKLNNDAFYRMPTLSAAEVHAAVHPGRTWHYQLDYQSALPRVGAIHAIDVALLFRTEPIRTLLRNDDDTKRLSATMRDAVVSFAKTGKPDAPGMPEWPPYEKKTRTTMIFDDQCRVVNDVEGHLRRYWK